MTKAPCGHLHCLLVRLEELAGELAEDGEVCDVGRGVLLCLLNKSLEDKIDAVPTEYMNIKHISNLKKTKKHFNTNIKAVILHFHPE